MESVSLNHPGLNSMKKRKEKKKDRTKRQVSDFQKPLNTEPQSPAEPKGAKWHQQQELSMLHLHFFMLTRTAWLAARDASVVDWLSVTFLSVVCEKEKKRITEISNIRLRPPCLTSSCRGNGLICAFNNFNQPCKCGGSCTEQKSGEAERKKQTETESGEHLRGSVVYNNLVWARVFDTYTVKTLNSKLKLKQKRLRYNRCHS